MGFRIIVDTDNFDKMYPSSNTKLGLYYFDIQDEEGIDIGHLSGDDLNKQLNEYGFKIVEL